MTFKPTLELSPLKDQLLQSEAAQAELVARASDCLSMEDCIRITASMTREQALAALLGSPERAKAALASTKGAN